MAITIGKLGIVRVTGPDMEALRWDCYTRDEAKCVICRRWLRWERGSEDSMHMAHIGAKSMYGDVIGNVLSKCGYCHLVLEHNPKSVPPKRGYGKPRTIDTSCRRRIRAHEKLEAVD